MCCQMLANLALVAGRVSKIGWLNGLSLCVLYRQKNTQVFALEVIYSRCFLMFQVKKKTVGSLNPVRIQTKKKGHCNRGLDWFEKKVLRFL